MDPITLGLMLGGGVVTGIGKLFAGQSEARTRNENAAMFDAQATSRLQKGEFDADASNRRWQRQQGETVAAIGTTGVSASSFLDVLMDDAAEASLERSAIRYTARQEATQLRRQASGQRAGAKDAIIGSYFGAAGAVLSSVATARGRTAGVGAGTPFDDPTSQF